MDLATFTQRALEHWNAIPARFREGVSAFVVDPGAQLKEEFEGSWIYGWCEPDDAIMAIPGAPVTSRITIFHGSFTNIAAEDPEFDWDEELWETIRHELQHHLEWRAGDDHLGDEDDLQDENERRVTGLPFTPDFHRMGLSLGDGAWLADGDLFLEVVVPYKAWSGLASGPSTHRWGAVEAVIDPIPSELLDDPPIYADADFTTTDGPDAQMPWHDVVVVLRRGGRWWPW